jgi:crotonobetainyl-CoA:carnitine CoA-transferase CaiB-like acyl-CoA transferase
MVLSDLGAEVDKVEDPGAGDYARVSPPIVDGEGALFQQLNRGKRSLVFDLKAPTARDAFLKLIRRYDVLVESFRPGVMERLGVGYETLRAAHPGLIFCAISGYGQTGPLAKRAGHDLNYLARAGILAMTGPDEGPPEPPGALMADVAGGALFGVIGVLSALRARDQSGEGRLVDIAMTEGAISLGAFGYSLLRGGEYQGSGGDLLSGGIAPYNTYRTQDGRAVALAALEPKFWSSFCAGVGLDVDFQALVPGEHQAEWKRRVAEIFESRTLEDWTAFAAEHDCCLEPILTPAEVETDAHFASRGVFTDVPTYQGGMTRQFNTPAGAPDSPRAAPERGADGVEILSDAGFSPDEIVALRDQGVVV